MARLRQQVEREHQIVAVEKLTELPSHALLHQFLTDAEPVADFQRPLGPADAARAFADPVGVVDQHHRHIALGKIDGGGQTHGPGADYDHRPPHRPRGVLIGRAAIIVGVDRLASGSLSRAFGHWRSP